MARLLSLPFPSATSVAERQCPIRIISVHLLDAAGRLLRVLFLDRDGHICAQPHYVPREQALILAANQQRVLGAQRQRSIDGYRAGLFVVRGGVKDRSHARCAGP
ncbi:MAG: hypothetical protein R6W06_04885 [Prochlorococcaceae cyanobacterium]